MFLMTSFKHLDPAVPETNIPLDFLYELVSGFALPLLLPVVLPIVLGSVA